MVIAILEGRKTMTRREIKPQPDQTRAQGKNVIEVADYCTGSADKGLAYYWKNNGVWNSSEPFKFPYGKVGDVLWVREKYRFCQPYGPESLHWYYATNQKGDAVPGEYDYVLDYDKWRPSIHMPKAACRIFLEITDIRVEQLQDITELDAKAEGTKCWYDKDGKDVVFTHRQDFQALWFGLSGDVAWEENPWVWVIEFKRIEKPSNFLS